MLPIRDFYGELDGKTIKYFVDQLDYSINTQEERLQKVKEILYSQNGELEPYFQIFFDKYYNPHITQEDFLSEDKNVFKMLNVISDYIINAPDAEPLTEKTIYNFYSEKEYKNKFYRHEKSFNQLTEKYNDHLDFTNLDNVIDFIKSDEENYKKEKKQKIYKSDLKDTDFTTIIKHENANGIYAVHTENLLKIYNDIIEYFGNKLDELKTKHKEANYKDKKIQTQIKNIKKLLKETKWDQLYCKDHIKGTIYFKAPMKDDGQIDYQLFNFTDKTHIAALLRCKPRDLTSDLGILIYDLETLIDECKFSEDDLQALNMYRNIENSYKDIGDELNITRAAAYQKIDRIINQIIKAYYKKYEDWLYLNYLKGDYKKCSSCGKIKLKKYFNPDKKNSDGLHSFCKTCR